MSARAAAVLAVIAAGLVLAFAQQVASTENQRVVAADRSVTSPSTTTTTTAGASQRSPGGRRVARIVAQNQLWIMATDGTDAMQVATCPQRCGAPTWSPGGTRVAYTTAEGTNVDVVVTKDDGSSSRQYATPDDASGLAWSADGNRLTVDDAGAPKYVIDVASGAVTNS